MILELLEADHQIAREITAEIGNSTQPGDEERLTKLRRWQHVWQAHQAVLEKVVYPQILRDRPDRETDIREVQQAQGQVIVLLDRTCQQAADRDAAWPESFEELRSAHEREYGIEMDHLASSILSDLKPDQIARLSREGRELHAQIMQENAVSL